MYNEKKNIFKSKLQTTAIVVLVLILVGISSTLGYVEGKNANKTTSSSSSSKYEENISLPESVYKAIIENYYRDITKKDLENMNLNASNGMLLALDPYSTILKKSLLPGYISELLQVKKIGLYIKSNFYRKYIVSGFFDEAMIDSTFIEEVNGAALTEDEKKIKRGDMLHSYIVSGKQIVVDGLDQESYVEVLNNLPDSFELVVERFESLTQSKYLKFAVNKKLYDITNSPTLTIVDEDTALVSFESFSDVEVFEQFRKDISAIKNNNLIKHLILDLRDNPGGDLKILQQVVILLLGDLSNLEFIKLENERKDNKQSAAINATTKISSGHQITNVNTSESLLPNRNDINFVVLANENTASAAEALIGILQNNIFNNGKMVALVGRKTYGKGVAQTQIDLQNGYILHLTTNKYFVMSDGGWENINNIGYLPKVFNVPNGSLTDEEEESLPNIPMTYESELLKENIKDDYIINNALYLLRK